MRLKEECNRLTATLKEERASFASRIASLETTVANLETSGAEKDAVILELTAVSSQKDSQIAELKAALRRSASRPDAEEMDIPDWGQGLPLEMLAAVAGGRQEMEAMRGVSKNWQQGFEASVRKLRIGPAGPLLPSNGSFCDRFAGLTSLDLGESPLAEADLAQLAGLKQLQTLILGNQESSFFETDSLSMSLFNHLSGSCFQYLRGLPITELYLNRAGAITREALGILQDLPLVLLDLSAVCDTMCELGGLRGMQIHTLVLSCEFLTDETLEAFVDIPLTSLNLSRELGKLSRLTFPSFDDGILGDDPFLGLRLLGGGTFRKETFTGVGLENLRGMSLRSLNLSGQKKLLDASLENLRGMPLMALNLAGCTQLTDEASGFLRGLGITDLDVSRCELLTDAALGRLVDLPLSKLILAGCKLITDEGLGFLRVMKLKKLDVEECKITSLGLSHVEGMPLRFLRVQKCRLVNADGLKYLYGMPLTKLFFGRCSGLNDADLKHLEGLPLKFLNLSGYSGLTDACMGVLKALPLKNIVLADCSNVSYMVDAEFERKGVGCHRYG